MTSRTSFSTLARVVAIAAAAVVGPPLAQAQSAKTAGPMPAMAASSSTSTAMSGMDMKAMMKDMGDKMSSMEMTGHQDVDFATMMRMHHQGAIDMARVEVKAGKDPTMRKMARAIIAAQKKEIAQMDRFLASRGHSTGKMKN